MHSFNVLLHEIIHALGVGANFYEKWVDPVTFKKYPRPSMNCYDNRTGRYFINLIADPLHKWAKQRYGIENACDKCHYMYDDKELCPAGVELEDDGGIGTMGSHLEARIYQRDLMTGYVIYDGTYISEVTLQMLYASGFYKVDMSLAEPYSYGHPLTNDGVPMTTFPFEHYSKWPEQYQGGFQGDYTTAYKCSPDMKTISKWNRIKYNCGSHRDICQTTWD